MLLVCVVRLLYMYIEVNTYILLVMILKKN